MHNKTKPYWFPAKRYGWGWAFPCAWQGWATFIIFIAVVSILSFAINPNANLLLFFVSIVGCAGVLLLVCYAKGEPPKWRWATPRDNKKNAEQPVDSNPH